MIDDDIGTATEQHNEEEAFPGLPTTERQAGLPAWEMQRRQQSAARVHAPLRVHQSMQRLPSLSTNSYLPALRQPRQASCWAICNTLMCQRRQKRCFPPWAAAAAVVAREALQRGLVQQRHCAPASLHARPWICPVSEQLVPCCRSQPKLTAHHGTA